MINNIPVTKLEKLIHYNMKTMRFDGFCTFLVPLSQQIDLDTCLWKPFLAASEVKSLHNLAILLISLFSWSMLFHAIYLITSGAGHVWINSVQDSKIWNRKRSFLARNWPVFEFFFSWNRKHKRFGIVESVLDALILNFLQPTQGLKWIQYLVRMDHCVRPHHS